MGTKPRDEAGQTEEFVNRRGINRGDSNSSLDTFLNRNSNSTKIQTHMNIPKHMLHPARHHRPVRKSRLQSESLAKTLAIAVLVAVVVSVLVAARANDDRLAKTYGNPSGLDTEADGVTLVDSLHNREVMQDGKK